MSSILALNLSTIYKYRWHPPCSYPTQDFYGFHSHSLCMVSQWSISSLTFEFKRLELAFDRVRLLVPWIRCPHILSLNKISLYLLAVVNAANDTFQSQWRWWNADSIEFWERNNTFILINLSYTKLVVIIFHIDLKTKHIYSCISLQFEH